MKKITKLAYAGAIALLSAGFYACSSSDEMETVNPTYDGKAVKTSFTISIGDVKGNATRMSETSVQKAETFQGMTDIYLFPANVPENAAITGTTVTSESYINLPDFSAFSTSLTDAQGKIYQDVSFSVGVNNFLFYAAIDNGKKDNGQLKPSYLKMDKSEFSWWENDWDPVPVLTSSTVGSITFDLVPILKDYAGDKDADRTKALNLVKTQGATTIAPLNAVDKAIAAQITAAGSNNTAVVTALTNLQKVLRNDKATGDTPDYKAYAGSSRSMLKLMTNLYNNVYNMANVLTVGETNYGAPILTAITNYFTATASTGGDYTLAWNTTTDPDFPNKALHLPDGSVALKYIGSNADTPFEYVDLSSEGLTVNSVGKYTFPARLYYTANSPAMVKNEEYLTTNEETTWNAVRGKYTAGPIKATTRSVIMQNQVQYAVGRLDVAVRVKPSATIMDNGSGTSDVSNPQPVTIPAGGYTLTGVLIGGQKQVGWDFTPVSSATELTIWDGNIADGITAKQQEGYSSTNSTLVLETAAATSATDPNAAVNIALEFTNTGNDFYGVDHNLIPAGTKFYLVAKLDPSNNTTYKEQNPETPWDGNDNVLKQVFKQDYVTTANLTIGENSLKNAYNVIPDLRSPKLEFGLSVDLHWRTGITFEQEF